MRKYRVTRAARRDLVEIARYTLDRWGDGQRVKYLSQLDDRFDRLAADPEHGIASEHLKPGYWRCHEGRHVIFYKITERGVDIIRVLHDRMLPERHL